MNLIAAVLVSCVGVAPSCPADLDGDRAVGFSDLLRILQAWGPCAGCPEDITGDDVVNFADLLVVLGEWGDCPAGTASTFARRYFPNEGIDGAEIVDVDDDGCADLVVDIAGVTRVYRVDSLGAITLTDELAAGGNALAGDFGGDGITDLLIAGDATSWLFPGLGDGTFGDGVVLDGGSPATIGDVDGDEDLDVVNHAGATTTVRLNDGDGTFTDGAVVALGDTPAISLARMNDDATLDLVAIDLDADAVTVLAGAGDGTFSLVASVPAAFARGKLEITDVNGDGALDAAAVEFVKQEGLHVDVFLGDGAGGLGGVMTATVPCFIVTADAFLRDATGDGTPDILGAGAFCVVDDSVPQIVLMEGNGDGTFDAPEHYLPLDDAYARRGFFAAGDLGSDGTLEFVLDRGGKDPFIDGWVIYGAPAAARRDLDVVGVRHHIGDLNEDGLGDIVTLTGDAALVTLADGDGFATPVPYSVAGFGRLVDYDGDEHLDLLVTNEVETALHRGAGDGTLGVAENVGPPFLVGLAGDGDFNEDGRLDLVVYDSKFGLPDVTMYVLLQQPDGALGAPMPVDDLHLHNVRDVVVRDLDADGHVDLAAMRSASVRVYLGDGDGGFTNVWTSFKQSRRGLGAGDLDGDGVLDLVGTTDRDVVVSLGRGDGTFDEPLVTPVFDPFNLGTVVVSDFDLNGTADVVTTGLAEGTLILFRGLGNGTLAPPERHAIGTFAQIATGDLGGDGDADVVVSSDSVWSGPITWVLLNRTVDSSRGGGVAETR